MQRLGVGFVAEPERFVGFGARSNAVDQSGAREPKFPQPDFDYKGAVENYVSDGPYYNAVEYGLMGELLPPSGTRFRPDATYFPIPWLLSSRGYGVLIDNDEMSYHRVAYQSPDAWSVEVETHELRFRVFGGPTPVDTLRRYTEALGRQPSDYAPWFFGPWLQTENDDQIAQFRADDVPTSLNATYLHYLPCGSQQGREEQQRIRTAANHDMGVAVTPTSTRWSARPTAPRSTRRRCAALLTARRRQHLRLPVLEQPTTLPRQPVRLLGPANRASAYGGLLSEAISDGYDGWMEDFGEYTPLDAVSAEARDRHRVPRSHPRDYHCGAYPATRSPASRWRVSALRLDWLARVLPDRLGRRPDPGWPLTTVCSPRSTAPLSIGTSGVGHLGL